MNAPYIQAIGTATPDHDIHDAFLDWAREQIADRREAAVFARMASRSGIAHRWSIHPPTIQGGSPVSPGGYYANGLPPTSDRMRLYGEAAPALSAQAAANLGEALDAPSITHLVVASCTGFTAPGLDQLLAKRLGLSGSVERTLVGFMGCYGAVIALRNAWHIVRSDPEARVLVVATELSTLHLQRERNIEKLLTMLLFGDGAAAAIVSAEPKGLAMTRQFAATLADSEDLIQWHIGDAGFTMELSGEVPGRISAALKDAPMRQRLCGNRQPQDIGAWAVHAGGRTVLDAVETGLDLAPDALADSRTVLRDCGNMSSATLLFVLERLLEGAAGESGIAIAFGPGLAAEGFAFERAG